ncbi:hypothetical protein N8455_00035 [Candidatus Gracilibacteria bacterium]|nr:hypothetical protein [Candidatus Gracilibacteria bacterium]
MAKSYVNLDTRIDSFTSEFNNLVNKVGDIAVMSTSGTDSDVVGGINNLDSDLGTRTSLTTTADQNLVVAINEIDAELGTITAGAMGTTASTVSTAIAELDTEADSDRTNLGANVKAHMLADGVSAQVTATANNSTNETVFPAFVDGATGAQGIETDTGLTYNPSTGVLTTTQTSVTTFNLGGTTVTADGSELNTLDGITAVVGELNALDLGSTGTGTAIASKAVILDGSKDYTGVRNLTISGELDAATLDISGAIDVAGTTNLDAVDIDGAVQVDGTVTVGVDDTGYDVKFFGDAASAFMQWDASADDLILGGAAGLIVPEGKLTLGSTAVTSTAAELNLLDGVSGLVQADLTKLAAVDATATELNIMDGDTSGSTVTVVDADRFVMNDGGVMKQVNASFLKTYFGLVSGGTAISALDLDGAPDIGAAIEDADLFFIDDGAGGTNRKATAARLLTYTNAGTLTTAAQTNITTLGRLDSAQIDDIKINGSTISTLSGTDLNISPLAGEQIVLDGTIVIDAGVVTGATSITSTAFVGNITGNVTGDVTGDVAGDVTGDVTGNADTATLATTVTVSANNTANEDVFITHVDGATGTQGLETDTTLKYNPSTGIITTTGFAGALTGNATTATALATARAFTTSGDVVITSTNFDGSANFSAAATIQASAVETSMIAADAITGAKIADDVIDTEHYADGGLEFAHMQNVAANSILARNANSSGVLSEVALATTQLLIGDGTGFTAAALSGDVTMTNAGVVTIGADKIDQGMISDDVISGAEMKTLRTFTLKDSAGTTLFTMFGAGAAT